MTTRKPKKAPTEVAEVTPPAPPVEEQKEETPPEPHIPVDTAPVAPKEPAVDPHKPRRSDSFDEVFDHLGEPALLPDAALPDVFQLLGLKENQVPEEEQSGGYRTEMVKGAGDVNLIWHPAIVCGRCDLCGSTRYVGGEVWKQIERKTGEVKWKYRGGHWVEVSAKNCPHYRNVKIACSYCREEFTGAKDRLNQFSERLGSRNIYVISEPGRPKVLIMVCSDFTCKNKFNDQFNINNPS